MATERYLPVEMPERFVLEFQLDDGSWMDWGAYKADYFQRLDDGTYVGGGNGSPVWIRCVEQHEDHFIHVDGGGDRHRYRLVPLPTVPDDD